MPEEMRAAMLNRGRDVYKLLLMSILFAIPALPAFAARDPSPRRGLRRAIVSVLVFNFVYMLALIFVYPRICW